MYFLLYYCVNEQWNWLVSERYYKLYVNINFIAHMYEYH